MILYEDNVVKLDYSPARDVVELVWPEMQEVYLPEIKQALNKTVEAIRLYDIKNLLIDASTTAAAISSQESQAITLEMARELSYTRLQRLARIEALDPIREQANRIQLKDLKELLQLSFELKTFSDKNSALSWLQAAGHTNPA